MNTAATGSSVTRRSRYEARRARLLAHLPGRTVLLHNGGIRLRNVTSSGYPFRASSHVLYFAGSYPPGAIVLLGGAGAEVFLERPGIDEAVWDGAGRPWADYETDFGVRMRDRRELAGAIDSLGRANVVTIPSLDPAANAETAKLLGRAPELEGSGRDLALAIVETRILQDELALSEIKTAVDATSDAYRAAMSATKPGCSGFDILAQLQSAGTRRGLAPSFSPIVTAEPEVIHSTEIAGRLSAEQMLLVDFGLETASGFCSDVTRTWPVSGAFLPVQKAVYEVVLETQAAGIEHARAGALFGDVHTAACRKAAEGLTALGILRGDRDSLVERGAHTLFFPHGLGHLLGADVHDLEDLGDLAGYADGQARDSRFGWKFLRLNRRLRAGMCITIEPGIYFIPALLDTPAFAAQFEDCLDRTRLAMFREVRGIRIEDDVLVGDGAGEVLTKDIPKSIGAIESAVGK